MSPSFQVSPAESSLLITEPYFDLPNIQDVYDQFVFEEYEFNSYYRCTRKCRTFHSARYCEPLRRIPPDLDGTHYICLCYSCVVDSLW